MENLKKSVVFIVAFRDFRDEEYFIPKRAIEQAGFNVFTASTKQGVAVGADGGEAVVDVLVGEVNPKKHEAIIFIGGPGALRYLDNDESYRLARETRSNGKVLGAICIAPVVLAKAGMLDGKKATVWSSPLDKSTIRILQDHGAEYAADSALIDGKLVTANGPSSAHEFGEKLLTLLNEEIA